MLHYSSPWMAMRLQQLTNYQTSASLNLETRRKEAEKDLAKAKAELMEKFNKKLTNSRSKNIKIYCQKNSIIFKKNKELVPRDFFKSENMKIYNATRFLLYSINRKYKELVPPNSSYINRKYKELVPQDSSYINRKYK